MRSNGCWTSLGSPDQHTGTLLDLDGPPDPNSHQEGQSSKSLADLLGTLLRGIQLPPVLISHPLHCWIISSLKDTLTHLCIALSLLLVWLLDLLIHEHSLVFILVVLITSSPDDLHASHFSERLILSCSWVVILNK